MPDGDRPPQNASLHFRAMHAQVCSLLRALNRSDRSALPWEALTRAFPDLDDVVDQTAGEAGLAPADMRARLIRLYRTYTAEWEAVEPQLAASLLNARGDHRTSDRGPVTGPQD